ncbi:hypothetical protein Csa_014517 [Cucumis sativus]|uniref:Uncharacterized protein n=1 Tax=Cucumis sativus TaxID=3659 RepID=A0A0A0KXV8_CUCSA|nr:hypothetical protein Csa_014517 [Cucumis sativus]
MAIESKCGWLPLGHLRENAMVAVVALIKKTEMANGSEQRHHSVLLLDKIYGDCGDFRNNLSNSNTTKAKHDCKIHTYRHNYSN